VIVIVGEGFFVIFIHRDCYCFAKGNYGFIIIGIEFCWVSIVILTMFSFCCFAFESGQHCGKKVYAMYFGWEEGSVEGTWAKAFKSCRCTNFIIIFHCFYFILVLLFCLFGLLQLEGIIEVHFFPFFFV